METIEVQIDLEGLAAKIEARLQERAEALDPDWAFQGAVRVMAITAASP
jgi:hypothetical protein